VKEAMGHSDLRTMGYPHLAREHLKSLVAEPVRQKRENAAS
jgi:hypothetical protein